MSESPSNSSRVGLRGWLRESVKGRKGGSLPSGGEMMFQALGTASKSSLCFWSRYSGRHVNFTEEVLGSEDAMSPGLALRGHNPSGSVVLDRSHVSIAIQDSS